MISYQLRQREYLLQISRAMTSRLDLPSLLRLILTSASEMVRAEAGLDCPPTAGSPRTWSSMPATGFRSAYYPASPRCWLICRCKPSNTPSRICRCGSTWCRARHPAAFAAGDCPAAGFGDRLLGVIYLFAAAASPSRPTTKACWRPSPNRPQSPSAMRSSDRQVSAEKQQLDAIIEHGADGVMILDPGLRDPGFQPGAVPNDGWSAEGAICRPSLGRGVDGGLRRDLSRGRPT